MNFIKVTSCLGNSICLINTDWIEEISPCGSGSNIYMAFTESDDMAQDCCYVKESIDSLYEMITGETGKQKSISDEISKALCTLADFCKQQETCAECPFGFHCSLRTNVPSEYDNLIWMINEVEK